MQQAHYPKIVAFVEGTMEKIFVNSNFSYVHLIQLNNGSSWTLPAMREQILTNFRVLASIPDFIVVWFDREGMPSSASAIADEIRDAIASEGYPSHKVAVLIPDKMCENLILADQQTIRQEFSNETYEYPGDGTHGKSLLKCWYKDAGQNYKETFHGVRLLKKIRLNRCAESSSSAKKFVEMLDLECWWK